ncbi:MAG: restriction endonuclease subunit S [Sterolibacterium sp.]
MRAALERVSIESLCANVTSGGTPSRADPSLWEDGVMPWFKTGELKDWYVYDAEEKIAAKAISQSSAKVFPPNTVLMAMYGDGKTITSLGILRNEAATNQACCAMIADPTKSNFLYLFYALKYHRHELLQLVVAGAQRNLSGGIIRKFKILWYPLPVQNRIADLLSAYDDLIENNRRRMELLEESARLLYREWFVRLRFPGYEHTRISDSVPDGWERVPLEGALVLQRGFDLPTQDRQQGTVPIYGSTGILGYHDKAKASAPGVVTGRSGTLGEVQYVAEDYWPLNTALWVKEFRRVTPLFALFLLREMDLRQYNGGASVPTLDRKSVHRVEVLIPSTLLLRSFDELAADFFAQIKNLNTQNQKLRAARDLLLPRLMSGDIAA